MNYTGLLILLIPIFGLIPALRARSWQVTPRAELNVAYWIVWVVALGFGIGVLFGWILPSSAP
ncbi:MAG TPA: hypothetical protein PKC43_10510 [Phycisphaerales bacterium]|nr:hypothetical protein [Phycisphaerales bacterium]HMP37867.1 hypothetical protein [Phycisphaerales bacterium]